MTYIIYIIQYYLMYFIIKLLTQKSYKNYTNYLVIYEIYVSMEDSCNYINVNFDGIKDELDGENFILNRKYACSFKMFLEKHACFKMLQRRIEYLGVVDFFHDEALLICNWSVQLFIPLECIKTKSIICFALKFSN